MSRAVFLFAAVGLVAGCKKVAYDDYYEDRSDPVVDSLDVTKEAGNAGGKEIVIRGSGFGDEASDVVVLIANHNAEVLSVASDEIRIVTPRGPITGGAVDLLVATASGYTLVPGAYTYDVAGDTYEGERGYIVAYNLFDTCYGGYEICQNSFPFYGYNGVDGKSEFFTFGYPRVHTPNIGWLSASDVSLGGWAITPPEGASTFSVNDLRKHVDGFRLVNPAQEGESQCIDWANVDQSNPLADEFYDNTVDCDDVTNSEDARRYDLDEMRFCEGEDAETGPDFTYTADWPVFRNFWEGNDDGSVDIRIDAPSAGVDNVPALLPPPMVIGAEAGFTNLAQWFVSPFPECFDTNGDGESRLDEDGIVLSWEPIPGELDLDGETDDSVQKVNSWIHASVTMVDVGWFGLELSGVRATTTVSDTNLYDDDTGRAYVGIPNSVLYQIPSPNFNWSGQNQLTGNGYLGTWDSQASYLFIEVYRVTDYVIDSDDGDPMVFSYVTGDITISQWENPKDREGQCEDCIDTDGDGWSDDLDPDCNPDVGGNGELENNVTSAFTCNDGIDNNGDDLVDSDDPLCENGWDGETTCGDGLDNDADGWVDGLDGECVGDPGANELGNDDAGWTCSNGLDDDGDGWLDAGDAACTVGSDTEDDGFLGTACNDGEDDDGHGDADALDPYCWQQGAATDAEAPDDYSSRCIDAKDNLDADGFIDGMDPDCDLDLNSSEGDAFWTVDDDVPRVPQCYDGEDNDGDGFADALDTSCWNPALGFLADGFLNDESAALAGDCGDGDDNDDDGWTDVGDPDCQPDAAHQEEVGFGTTECNDGIDNDGDGDFDGADSYCDVATDTWEGPDA